MAQSRNSWSVPRRLILGLASGATLDGVDAALVEVSGLGLDMRLQLIESVQTPFPKALRNMLEHCHQNGNFTLSQWGQLERVMGEMFAHAALQLLDKIPIARHDVLALGLPGHTLWMRNNDNHSSIVSVGMPGVVAEATGITTWSGFRKRDLIMGGSGMPLTAIVDHIMFRNAEENRVLINLGGVSSIVLLPANGTIHDMIGFHAGPCNRFLNLLMARLTNGKERYDPWGKYAVQGCCIGSLLGRWLNHPALQRHPPKTISEEDFGIDFVEEILEQALINRWGLHDVLCTATHFVAASLAHAVMKFLPVTPQRILLSGGGVRNGLVRNLLEHHFENIPVTTTEEMGVAGQARKAVGFAGLTALTMDGVPGNVVNVTGAKASRLLGEITPGSMENWASCLAWMSGQSLGIVAA